MNKLKQYAEGKVFSDTCGNLRRFNQETHDHEYSEDGGKTWVKFRGMTFKDFENWQLKFQKSSDELRKDTEDISIRRLYDRLKDIDESIRHTSISRNTSELIKTYRNEDIEFTVEETEYNEVWYDYMYELQFQKFPDELRGIGMIGKIDDISIWSQSHPHYCKNNHLNIPGESKNKDDEIIVIPKKDVSENFFSQLFHTLKKALTEKRDEVKQQDVGVEKTFRTFDEELGYDFTVKAYNDFGFEIKFDKIPEEIKDEEHLGNFHTLGNSHFRIGVYGHKNGLQSKAHDLDLSDKKIVFKPTDVYLEYIHNLFELSSTSLTQQLASIICSDMKDIIEKSIKEINSIESKFKRLADKKYFKDDDTDKMYKIHDTIGALMARDHIEYDWYESEIPLLRILPYLEKWKPCVLTKTYSTENENIVFTVVDNGKHWRLRFDKLPDELIGNNPHELLGSIGDIKVYKNCGITEFYNAKLSLPGKHNNPTDSVYIEKHIVDETFFNDLLTLLEKSVKEVKPKIKPAPGKSTRKGYDENENTFLIDLKGVLQKHNTKVKIKNNEINIPINSEMLKEILEQKY